MMRKNIKSTNNTPPIGKNESNPISKIASRGLYHVKPVNIKLLIYCNNVANIGI